MNRALLVLLLLAPTAAAQSLFPPAPHDLRYEWAADEEGAANGLPTSGAPGESLVLDAKALLYAGATHPALGFEWGVPYNEWAGPILFPDENTGERRRNLLVGGLVRFHAWYGLWDDKDQDQAIDAAPGVADEWRGIDDAGGDTPSLLGFLTPGYHPAVNSDHYVLGGFASGEAPPEYEPDFEMVPRGDGNWISSHTVLETDGSLVRQIVATVVANGTQRPMDPGWACSPTVPGCRVDVDTYHVIDPVIAALYGTVLQEAAEARKEVETIAEPVTSVAGPLVEAAAAQARTTLFTAVASETDAADPWASMTAEHGAPRAPGGYSFALEPHAWLDLTVRAYAGEPNAVALALPPLGMPVGEGASAAGLAPTLVGLHARTGVFHDDDGDGAPASRELVGSCQTERGATTVGGAVPAGAPAPTGSETGPSPIEYQNRPSALADGPYLTGVLEAVDDDGEPTTWGPLGAYVLREDDQDDLNLGGHTVDGEVKAWDDAAWDLKDLSVDRHVREGPIPFLLRCDDEDPGHWFSAGWYGGSWILLPTGTTGFHLRATLDDGQVLRFTDPSGTVVREPVWDADLVRRWV